MRTDISFSKGFYQRSEIHQSDPGVDSLLPTRTLLSDKKFQGVSLEALMNTDDFKVIINEYVELINGFIEFVKVNGCKIKPPLSEGILSQVKENLNSFSSHISDISLDYFSEHKSVIYGAGKGCAHALTDLLASDGISMQKRLDSVVKMSQGIALCSGGGNDCTTRRSN